MCALKSSLSVGEIASISNVLDILEGLLYIVREVIEFRGLCEQWLSRLYHRLLR